MRDITVLFRKCDCTWLHVTWQQRVFGFFFSKRLKGRKFFSGRDLTHNLPNEISNFQAKTIWVIINFFPDRRLRSKSSDLSTEIDGGECRDPKPPPSTILFRRRVHVQGRGETSHLGNNQGRPPRFVFSDGLSWNSAETCSFSFVRLFNTCLASLEPTCCV